MLQHIPWSSYTWRTHADVIKSRLSCRRDNDAELVVLEAELARVEKELQHAEYLGVADEPLPDDYGTRTLSLEKGFVHANPPSSYSIPTAECAEQANAPVNGCCQKVHETSPNQLPGKYVFDLARFS